MAVHPSLEHRGLAGASPGPVPAHAQAAQPALVRLADEAAQRLARLVGALAVQVDLRLDAPVALAQLARHLGPDAGAAEAQVLVGVQRCLGVELVAERLAHHRLLVELALLRSRLRRLHPAQVAAVMRQPLHRRLRARTAASPPARVPRPRAGLPRRRRGSAARRAACSAIALRKVLSSESERTFMALILAQRPPPCHSRIQTSPSSAIERQADAVTTK